MNSIKQLLRRPWKTLLGTLLSLLACAIICVCLGQYIASVQTRAYVEDNYTTVGILTSKYMTEDILDEDGNVLGVTYSSEQPFPVTQFISEINSFENTSFVKSVQQSLLTSAYLPDAVPLNYYGSGAKPVFIDANADATNDLDVSPYTYAMFMIQVDEVGEIRPFIYYEPSLPIDTSAYGYAIDITGTILETVSLQQSYADPCGRTIHVTVRFASEEEGKTFNFLPGQNYLICGTDYQDLDAQMRLDVAQICDCEVSEVDWSNIQWLTEEEQDRISFDCVAKYLMEDGGGAFLSSTDAQMVDSCSLTVCRNPLVYNGRSGQEEISLNSGIVLSAAEYCAQFKDSDIALIGTTVQDFLNQTDEAFWQEWLNTAAINDRSFPVIAVDNLNAIAQFANQDATVVDGRVFTQEEIVAGAKVCVISESLAIANGLSVGDTIAIQYFDTDMEVRDNKTLTKQANPNPAYYSAATGFADGAEDYMIVGLYRQKNEWAIGTYCFTPNTVFVPQSAVSGNPTSICGGIYTSVIVENGTANQLEQLAAEHGFEGLFVCYDQGYSQIMASLEGYYEVGYVVLRTGFALWIGIVLLFLFLFPYQLRQDLNRMWDLGTPPAKIRRHVFVSSAGMLLPGAAFGCITSALLFRKMTQYIATTAKSDLTLEVSIGTLGLVAAMQLVVVLVMVYSFSWIMTTSVKKHNRRK
ncbi:MAG: hypothetical protein ACI3VZ_02545 [Faecousia sp.]